MFLRFGGLSDRLNTDRAVFSETRRAVELLQQFNGLFLFLTGYHHTRSCPAALFDTHSVFFPLVRSAVCPQQRQGNTSPVSIVFGDGYSVFKVQYQEGNQNFH